MERDESADDRRARVVLLEHAPCGSSVCLLQERKRSREVVPRLATVHKHISGEQTVILVNTEPPSCIVSPYQGLPVLYVYFFCRLLSVLPVQKCYQLPPLRHHVGDM